MENILKYWPMKDSVPRKTQQEVLSWMESLPPHIKYVLCEVPVGGGKSPIALNYSGFVSGHTGSSYILTPQKVLQKQYEDSFNKSLLASLYGKSNYSCSSKKTNCDIGSDIKPKCATCPHRNALLTANGSPNCVLNYTLAFLLFKYVSSEKTMTPRQLMVFDECHTLEGFLTEFNAVQISEKKCKQLNIKWVEHKNAINAHDWLKNEYKPVLVDIVKKLFSQVENIYSDSEFDKKLTNHEIDIINKFKDLSRHLTELEEFLFLSFSEMDKRYVFVSDKTFFKFKELYGKHIFKDICEPMAEKFLFLSSTILNKEAFCSDLGIDPKKTAFISMDSEFPIENRPILYMPKMKMTYGWDGLEKKKDREYMISSIIDLINYHKDDNGIIHTGSFQVAEWLIKNLEGKIPHIIFEHGPKSGNSRDEVLEEFQQDDNRKKILISPSITEGLDLKDNKGRFAIWVKVPYPYLGDAWVKRRQLESSEWYSRQAMIAMIQGGGRIVRSKDDWGNVYILDESFSHLLKTMKNKIPKWWIDSIEIID